MRTTRREVPVARLRGVTKVFGTPGHESTAVRDVSLEAYRGELLLLLGPSGSGKTTLLTLIAGLLEPTSGRVEIFGRDVASMRRPALQALRARCVGFVFQTFRLLEALTALENVLLLLQFAGVRGRVARRRARVLLTLLGIGHLGHKRTRELSHGEKQRVAVARALAARPSLIIADEPTASLDSAHGLEIVRLLREAVRREGCCVIVTSHDERIGRYADRVLRLADGELWPAGQGDADEARTRAAADAPVGSARSPHHVRVTNG